MKKLLTLLTVVGLTTTTTTTVIACGKDVLKINKIQLDSVLKNLTVDSDTTIDNVIDVVLLLPENSGFDVLEKANLEVQAGSFVAADYGKDGSAVIKVKEDSKKYTGSITVTITAKVKIQLSDVITSKELDGNIEQSQVIEKLLELNPNSGVSSSDIKIVNFRSPNVGTNGSATIQALDSSGFIGSVDITIILFPKDAELTEIINEIKSTPPETLEAIEIWKKYFDYYSQDKIQYMINTIKSNYTVDKNDDEATKKKNLINQVLTNTMNLLHQVIATKDGLANIRYDSFSYGSFEIVTFDETNNIASFKVPLYFGWQHIKNGENDHVTLNETRSITINFQQI